MIFLVPARYVHKKRVKLYRIIEDKKQKPPLVSYKHGFSFLVFLWISLVYRAGHSRCYEYPQCRYSHG